jgi:Putative beta barrel porin-7 (BBP7)
MPGSHVFRRHGRSCVGLCLLLVVAVCSPLGAQEFVAQVLVAQPPPGTSPPSRLPPEVVEPAPDGTDPLLYEPRPMGDVARYDEPPPPPFDYWQPTWMPCQSLRTNRSLVLGHLWFGMDILGWSTKGVHAPPLVTSGSLASGGIIGQDNTRILFGNEQLNNELRPGGRLTIGWWFDPNQYSGIEWHYFELDGKNTRFNAANDTQTSILARPIIDATTGLPDAVLTASDTRTGSIRVSSDLQLTSTGILFRDLIWASDVARLDYLVGYRHTHLFDRLRTDESITGLAGDPQFTAGQHITRVDQFRAVNQFDGADLGLRGWWSRTGTLAVTGAAKIALGASNNNVIINGYTREGTGRNATTTQGGALALPSNITRTAQQEFGIVSEIGLGLEWQPICYWKFSLGYTWFYWSEVARAASQLDTTVGGTHPLFQMHTTSFWAQGLNAGFAYQF